MVSIHETAVVSDKAHLSDSVTVGPYCVVDEGVTLGAHVVLHSHVVVTGLTSIGRGCEVFPFASLGYKPQDLKYRGEPSRLEIGQDNTIREHVTMNSGTEKGGMVTKIGDGGLFMVGTHIAHDCQVGNGVILANNATLAGHVHVGDYAVIGGLAAVHQFVRIGAYAMIGGLAGVENDVIPFGSVVGKRAWLAGLNLVGLKRHGFSKDEIHQLRHAIKALFSDDKPVNDMAVDVMEMYQSSKLVGQVIAFIQKEGTRGLTRPLSSE